MPNEKSIEVERFLLTPPFGIVVEKISMYEYKESIDQNIEMSLEILSKPESGMLSYEYFRDDIETVFRIQKVDSGKFAFWDVAKNELSIIGSSEVLPKLYEHMPYVAIVGTEKGVDIQQELSSREITI